MTFRFQLSRRILFGIVGGFLGLIILFSLLQIYYFIHYINAVLPQVMISSVAVGSKTKLQALDAVNHAIDSYTQNWPLTFTLDQQKITVEIPTTAVQYSVNSSVESAFTVGRWGLFTNIALFSPFSRTPITTPLELTIDEQWLAQTAASLSAQVDVPAVPPVLEIKMKPNGEKIVEAIQGQNGHVFNQSAWIQEMKTSFKTLTLPNQLLVLEDDSIQVTPQQIDVAVERANALLKQQLVLTLDLNKPSMQSWILTGTDLVKFIHIDGTYADELIADYVNGTSQSINRPAKDAKFTFDVGSGKVSEFVPAEDGITVLVPETVMAIKQALDLLARNETIQPVRLATERQQPTVTLESVNRMGIKELIGVGKSTYKGSIPGRVHNVELAAARINGTLVKPGEEFSFNEAVGEVSAKTGYQQAYIIQDGKTQLGDGGGVCQDSTTVFRAALNAGMPISMRRGHAYRVGYYEQDAKPGMDATVYAPSTDFRFLNDTPGYVLINTQFDTPNRALTVYIYGTSDGRKATIKDQALWDVTPPPPDIYTDDPTLPAGVIKQVDWKAPGSKAKFTYVVERNGQVVYEKTFITIYRPWAAAFLRGTKS